MLASMTGFGKSNGVFQSKKVSVEIRSLNSKGLDLNVKLSSSYKDAETDIRKIVAESLDRGKIDVGIFIESTNTANKNKINHELAKSYYHELKQLNESWGEEVKDYLSLVLKMPEVLSQESEEISEAEKESTILLTLFGLKYLSVYTPALSKRLVVDKEEVWSVSVDKTGYSLG
jgi:uncharacterized protein (TIGR00255 family)